MPFPRKRLMFEQTGVDQGLLDELNDLKKFLRGIDDTSATWLKTASASSKVFLPHIAAMYSLGKQPGGLDIDKAASRSSNGKNNDFYVINNGLFSKDQKGINAVFKVNVPGFVYRQHFNGVWNPGPEVAVFVAYFSATPTKATAAAAKWLCLFRSRGTGDYVTSTSANNHANNFFPINPGSHTYILVMTSGKFFSDYSAQRQSIMYIPAFGYTGKPLTLIGKWSTKTNTTGTIDVNERLTSLKEAFT